MSRTQRLRPLAGLLAAGLAVPALAGSAQFPTYVVGPQPNGSAVVSSGQIITPAGIQVGLECSGTTCGPVRAKAVAVNPNTATHTAAVLLLGARNAVEVFNTQTGQVIQSYSSDGGQDNSGSYGGIAYSADGKYLLFSQASSNIAIANVDQTTGMLSDAAHIPAPPNTSFIQCFPNSPMGNFGRPCGQLYSTGTSYPGGVAWARNGRNAYVLLNQNNTLATINFNNVTANPPPQIATQIRVGNSPNSILLNGNLAYISNEGGRPARSTDFQVLSSGTPIVADPTNGFSVTGTVSVVDLKQNRVVSTINVGLHPTGMAMVGPYLLVSNTYDDTISVIDTGINKVVRTISLRQRPLSVPGTAMPLNSIQPVGIAVDERAGVAYVAGYHANAVVVVDLNGDSTNPVMGFIPVAYAPASVVIDRGTNSLIVANDKGTGTQGSQASAYGVTGYNSHQDTGTVSIIPLRGLASQLANFTSSVVLNNHWDASANIAAAGRPNANAAPVAIPAHIGEPSLIKNVFLIIRENRTYDQMLGDVAAGNGDPTLAVFGVTPPASFGVVTPNMHNLITRFPLLDNFYDPSRQSADGHNWIVQAQAPYADDIQSPYWIRSYPSQGGDALAYTSAGFLWQKAAQAGLSVKLYGEYAEQENFPTSFGEPTWEQFYQDSLNFEANTETTLKYQTAVTVASSIPSVQRLLVPNFPPFDTNIPDQWRVDWWVQDFNRDLAQGTLPALSFIWIMCDHTGGDFVPGTPLTPQAEQADNDLAVGRIIDIISHSSVWNNSAIFIEEDDAQNGVDHVDGHRSPGYIVSPYAVQATGSQPIVDNTFYTQVNMTRTIEQILGVPPMNAFDLIASPMLTDFTNTPNAAPWSHVPNQVPLGQTQTAESSSLRGTLAGDLASQWIAMKNRMFEGKTNRADSVDPDLLNHYDWYAATNFSRPYPGEKSVRVPGEFADKLVHPNFDLDD